MMLRAVGWLVGFSRRNAAAVAACYLALAVAGGVYTARNIAIDTDESKLISPNLPWRRTAADLDREFPQNTDLIAVVVDAPTPDRADDAAAAVAARMRSLPGTFRNVRRPDALPFFRRNGLLFLSRDEVQKFADDMITAQPMLGTLAADPSLRGVFDTLDLLAVGALRGQAGPEMIDPPLKAVARAAEAAAAGTVELLSWQTLLGGRKASPRELRRFVLAQPSLDFKAVEPGHAAVEAVREAAREIGAVARVRVTGPVALNDDQLSTLSKGAGVSASLLVGLLCFWIILGLRSAAAVTAVLATLVAGLVACAAFAVGAIGPFNPISVAFAPLFVGIAIDFGIQFSVRHAAESSAGGTPDQVFARTATGIGGALCVAAASAAVGFLSFVPTDYTGVRDLGLIAGVGMLIALVLNLTLLPALLSLLGRKAAPEAPREPWAKPLDRFILGRRAWILSGAAVLGAAALALIPGLRFDFNPINLQDQTSESVATLHDLMRDPETSPNTIDVLAPSPEAADALAAKLSGLPGVAQVIYARSFVPGDQQAKLEILADARSLLGPTLDPAVRRPAPSQAETLASIGHCAADMRSLGKKGDAAASRLADALDAVLSAGEPAVKTLSANLSDGVDRRLEDLRLALGAGPVSLDTLPADATADWIGADGRWRLQVNPKGDSNDNDVLRRFCAAVKKVAPDATGTPVTIQASADTVTHAFATAGVLALAAIVVLLAVVLRRPADVALVLIPLLLAVLLTLATGVVVGLPLNFANIIALPLLLGIGVAFDIYFVMRWRAGEDAPLSSSTAKAVLFSALTTGSAFGSLALSKSPGLGDMGKLLCLALAFTLLCTFVFLPALLGPVPRRKEASP